MADNGNTVLDGLYLLAKSLPNVKAQAKAYIEAIIGTIVASASVAWADITGKPTLVEEAPIDGTPYARQDATWVAGGGGFTTEQAQDAIGTILTDTATIDFTYTDATPTIEASVKAASITEAMQVLADNTTNDVSTTKHGYVPKAPNDTSKVLVGNGTWATLVSIYDYDEATAYFGALATPLSATQEARIIELVLDLKEALNTNTLSTRLDCFYVFANETAEASLLNLIKRSHDATNVHSTAWAQWEGYTGDGANDYINTNYNPSTQKVALSQNNASMGIYCRTDNRSDGYVDAGCSSAGTEFKLHLSWTDGNQYLRCFTNGGCTDANDNTQGFIVMSRPSSAVTANGQYLTASSIFTGFSIASTAPPNYNVYVCGDNGTGTLTAPSTGRQYSIFFIGSSLTRAETTSMMLAVEKYMDAIGKGVI